MVIQDHALNRFISQHKVIKFHLEGIPPEGIYKRFEPEQVSIHEIIAYLCRYQYVFLNRINSICSDLNPSFAPYQADIDPQLPFMISKRTGSLLHEINRMRENLVRLVKELPENYTSRMGTHTILGKMNIPQWLDFFLLHESLQHFKIFKLTRRFWNEEMKSGQLTRIVTLESKIEEIA